MYRSSNDNLNNLEINFLVKRLSKRLIKMNMTIVYNIHWRRFSFLFILFQWRRCTLSLERINADEERKRSNRQEKRKETFFSSLSL